MLCLVVGLAEECRVESSGHPIHKMLFTVGAGARREICYRSGSFSITQQTTRTVLGGRRWHSGSVEAKVLYVLPCMADEHSRQQYQYQYYLSIVSPLPPRLCFPSPLPLWQMGTEMGPAGRSREKTK